MLKAHADLAGECSAVALVGRERACRALHVRQRLAADLDDPFVDPFQRHECAQNRRLPEPDGPMIETISPSVTSRSSLSSNRKRAVALRHADEPDTGSGPVGRAPAAGDSLSG